MIFVPTELSDAWLIEPELISDERGSFARIWCAHEFEERGLNPRLVQCNISFNHRRGTLRGMHYQRVPYAEAKLVRCTRGTIWDVIVDLRRESPTYCRWFAVELSAENRRALFIPEGVAHGFQTLTDDSEVFYQMSQTFHPESSAGVRWNDVAFGIRWPDVERRIISSRDASYPDYHEARLL